MKKNKRLYANYIFVLFFKNGTVLANLVCHNRKAIDEWKRPKERKEFLHLTKNSYIITPPRLNGEVSRLAS
jgi:hypothetical protein